MARSCVAGSPGRTGLRDLTSAPRPRAESPAARIEYHFETSKDNLYQTLHATVNGRDYPLVGESEKLCLRLVEEKDFDRDGLPDILVSHIVGCGGNCCGDAFFFVSYLGNGRFERSAEFGYAWSDPVIEESDAGWSVVVTSANEGVNQDRPKEITQRFVLKRGKAVKVAESERKSIDSLAELRSEQFNAAKPGETRTLTYDLDGDGLPDRIVGTLWLRWGRIRWIVHFGRGGEFAGDDACKRIGVLSTRSEGVADLVCDQDRVLRWDGRGYR